MDDMEIRKKALAQLMGDMDGLEGEGMFQGSSAVSPADASKGVDVNISIVPKGGDNQELKSEMPSDEDAGGDEEMEADENRGLPPFLRKAMKKAG